MRKGQRFGWHPINESIEKRFLGDYYSNFTSSVGLCGETSAAMIQDNQKITKQI